eukprot:1548786-Amphidinium_carterae.1
MQANELLKGLPKDINIADGRQRQFGIPKFVKPEFSDSNVLFSTSSLSVWRIPFAQMKQETLYSNLQL